MDVINSFILPLGLWGVVQRGVVFKCGGLLLMAYYTIFCAQAYLPLQALEPSVGLRWYFFVEVFSPFFSFYAGLWLLLLLPPLLALAFALRHGHLQTLALLLLAANLFQPHSSLAPSLLAALLLWPHALPMVRLALLGALFALPLGLLMRHLWLSSLAGNANFFYAATLVHAGFVLFVLVNQASHMLVQQHRRQHKYKTK